MGSGKYVRGPDRAREVCMRARPGRGLSGVGTASPGNRICQVRLKSEHEGTSRAQGTSGPWSWGPGRGEEMGSHSQLATE